MKYFRNVQDLQELRRQYKELLKTHHPDNGGNVADMQEINAEYDRLFKVLKNKHESNQTSTDGAKADFNANKYDFEADEKLREMLSKIINFNGVTIEVIGNWLWCFDSYQYRKELKELGFKYASQKRAWYYHTEPFRKRSNRKLSMEDIRNYYGSTEVQTEKRKQLKQA